MIPLVSHPIRNPGIKSGAYDNSGNLWVFDETKSHVFAERGFLKNREDVFLLGDFVERVINVGVPEGFPGR